MAVSHVLISPIADFTGTVTVFNSAGSTVTANATEIVRPSDWNSAHNQYLTLSGNTAGASTMSGTNIALQGGNNVTLSANGATLVFSGPNTVAQSVQPGIQTIAFANTTFTTGAVSFSNANGISFGSSGGQVTASHNGLTTAALSNHSHGNPTLALTNLTGTTASASNGLTLSLSGNAAQSVVPGIQSIAFANTTFTTGAVSFSNANGISFGSSGGQVTASHNAITTGRASTDAIGLATAQTNVTWTVNSAGLSFNAGGYAGTATGFTGANISGSMTHNTAGLSLSLSVAAPGGGGGAALSAGTQSVSTGTVAFANSNGITFGMSNSNQITASYNSTQFAGTGTTFAGANASASMTLNSAGLNLSFSVAAPGAAAEQNAVNLLGANTAGNTTATGSTIGMSGINLTLSGTNASQIVFSAPATSSLVGASGLSISTAGSTISIYQPVALGRYHHLPDGASSAGSAMTQGSMSFQRFYVPDNLSFTRVDIPIMIAFTSSAAANTAALLISSGCVIYSVSGTSTLNPIVGAFGTTTHTHASNTANFNSVSGPRFASFPLATMLTPGEYYVGFQLSTNNNSSVGTATTAIAAAISVIHGAIYTASQWQDFGAVTATSKNFRPFVGVAASVTATNQTQQLSNITQTGTALMRANFPVGFRSY